MGTHQNSRCAASRKSARAEGHNRSHRHGAQNPRYRNVRAPSRPLQKRPTAATPYHGPHPSARAGEKRNSMLLHAAVHRPVPDRTPKSANTTTSQSTPAAFNLLHAHRVDQRDIFTYPHPDIHIHTYIYQSAGLGLVEAVHSVCTQITNLSLNASNNPKRTKPVRVL